MVEALISAGLAVITGIVALNNRTHARIDESLRRIAAVDRRIDNLELNVVKDFVQKQELSDIISKMETHMVRIEDKLDQLRPFRRINDRQEEQ